MSLSDIITEDTHFHLVSDFRSEVQGTPYLLTNLQGTGRFTDRNGKVTNRQISQHVMLSAPAPGLTWTLRRSWRGQGKDAGNHQEGVSTWAVLACEGEEGAR